MGGTGKIGIPTGLRKVAEIIKGIGGMRTEQTERNERNEKTKRQQANYSLIRYR